MAGYRATARSHARINGAHGAVCTQTLLHIKQAQHTHTMHIMRRCARCVCICFVFVRRRRRRWPVVAPCRGGFDFESERSRLRYAHARFSLSSPCNGLTKAANTTRLYSGANCGRTTHAELITNACTYHQMKVSPERPGHDYTRPSLKVLCVLLHVHTYML